MSDDKTAGTTADGTATASGTTVDGNAEIEALRKRAEQLEREKQQHLAEKSNYEAAKQRLAELEANLTRPANGNGFNPMRVQAMLAEDIQLASQGDEMAQYRVALAQAAAQGQQIANQTQQQLEALEQLLTIPDSDRGRVKAISKEHGVPPLIAHKILLGERATEAEARLQAREAELMSATNKKPVATAAIGLTAAQTADKAMKRSEFNALYQRLEQENPKEADALLRREDSGELQITPG